MTQRSFGDFVFLSPIAAASDPNLLPAGGLRMILTALHGGGHQVRFESEVDPLRPPTGAIRAGVCIQRRGAPAWLSAAADRSATIETSTALGRLLASHLMRVASLVDDFSPEEGADAIRAALVLAEAAVEQREPKILTRDHSRYQAALRLIDGSILESSLNSRTLAAALGVSRSTLFRLFPSTESVSARIRRRRLESAHEALEARSLSGHTVRDIARTHLFPSESHFSRSFRRLYGYSPGTVGTR